MAIHVTVTLTEDPADLIAGYGAGAKLYLDSATSETGSYANVTSTALVVGTTVYEFWDSAGTSSTWYRSRAGNSGGSAFGAYSSPFQATSLAAYASLMDLRETMDLPDASRDNLLLDYLVDASEQVDIDCHRRFHRDPQVSGDRTVYVDVERAGCASLVSATGNGGYCTDGLPLDILSVTTLRIRYSESDDYAAVTAGDAGYLLQPGVGPGRAGVDWPYEDIVLSPLASVTSWPRGRRAVELVCARGFPQVPSLVRRAVIDKAREWYRAGPGGGRQSSGVNQFGVPVFADAGDAYQRLVGAGSPYVRRAYVG